MSTISLPSDLSPAVTKDENSQSPGNFDNIAQPPAVPMKRRSADEESPPPVLATPMPKPPSAAPSTADVFDFGTPAAPEAVVDEFDFGTPAALSVTSKTEAPASAVLAETPAPEEAGPKETNEERAARETAESEALARMLMAEEAEQSFALQYQFIQSSTADMDGKLPRPLPPLCMTFKGLSLSSISSLLRNTEIFLPRC